MPPPVRNAAATREAILVAAKQRFLHDSYDNVVLRDVAGDVGVDVSLIGRYFGSKEKLFREVLRHGKAGFAEQAPPAAELPAYLANLARPSLCENERAHIEKLQIILRSASSAKASEIVRSSFHEDVLHPLAALLPGEDAEMRASLAMSVLTGTTIMRAIMGVDALHECECPNMHRDLERLLGTALFGADGAA